MCKSQSLIYLRAFLSPRSDRNQNRTHAGLDRRRQCSEHLRSAAQPRAPPRPGQARPKRRLRRSVPEFASASPRCSDPGQATAPPSSATVEVLRLSFVSYSYKMANFNEDLSQLGVSQEEKDKLVSEVIRNVLFKTHQTSGCPIKREELTQIITKNYRQRSLPAFVINEAREKLSSIFGYEMKELQRTHPSSNKQNRASQQSGLDARSYIVVSQLPSDIYSKYIENKETAHVTGFTFIVIGIVHLAGGIISEENLWHQLKRIGVNESDDKHPVFGNSKQSLEALVQQRYLQKDKVSGPEGNTVMYELAERALNESIHRMLKDYIVQLVNKDTASID